MFLLNNKSLFPTLNDKVVSFFMTAKLVVGPSGYFFEGDLPPTGESPNVFSYSLFSSSSSSSRVIIDLSPS